MVNETIALNMSAQQAGAVVDNSNILVKIWGGLKFAAEKLRAGTATVGDALTSMTGFNFMPQVTIPLSGVTINVDLVLLFVAMFFAFKWMKTKFTSFDFMFFVTRTILIFALLTFI